MNKVLIFILLIIFSGLTCFSCFNPVNKKNQMQSNKQKTTISTHEKLFGQPVNNPPQQKQPVNEKEMGEDKQNIKNMLEKYKNANLIDTIDLSRYNGVITFDDGPHPETTQSLLEFLHTANVKNAIFFLVGYRIMEYPFQARLIDKYGYKIGYHSMFHKGMNESVPVDTIRDDIQSFKKALNNALSKEYHLRYARPLFANMTSKYAIEYLDQVKQGKFTATPFNAYDINSIVNSNFITATKREKLDIVLWNVDFDDWNKDVKIDNMFQYFKPEHDQVWRFHEKPLHFEIELMAVFSNKVEQNFPQFLNQLYLLNEQM